MEKTVLLLHPNRYFAKGLEHLIHQWFSEQKLPVQITQRAEALEKADIIFTTAYYHSRQWWRQFLRTRHNPLLFLLVEQRNILCCGYEDGQLAVTDPPQKLQHLLTTFVASQRPLRARPAYRQLGIVQCLSPREREVLWGYKQGLDNHQISRKSGMSIKAISAYRNHAMQKLLLKNHADLHYWLHSIAAENLSNYFRARDVFSVMETQRGRPQRTNGG